MSNTKAAKKVKLGVKVRQGDGTDFEHTLWLVKYCKKARTNLYEYTCKLFQGTKFISDHRNKILLDTLNGKILLDWRTKPRVG